MSERIYLMLGSNQGNRLVLLQEAIEAMKKQLPVSGLRESAVYETAAWGLEEQPAFLNQAICFDADINPHELLTQVRRIEKQLGRQRVEVWGPRTLDIDILFLGNQIVEYPDLIIPHPRIQERRFVLAPMHELAANLIHPVLNKSITELLDSCPDPLPVHIYIQEVEDQK